MPHTISIRNARPEDVTTILGFISALAEYEKAEPGAVSATEELLHQHLFGDGLGRGPTAECVIGEIDGAPQGFALWFMNFSTWRGKPGLYLEDLFVMPEARGKGLGRALLKHLARIAVGRGCERFEWIVLDWNEPALKVYRAIGAEPLSEWTVHRLAGEALTRFAQTD